MADIQLGVHNLDNDKDFNGLMESKPMANSSNPSLQVSVSFGRFEADSLSWEKFSAFSPNKYLEEVGKCATPGSVAQKKAYFEAHYKKIAERKAEMMMDQEEKVMEKNSSFRSVVTDDQERIEEDKHVTDIDDVADVKDVSVDELDDEESIVVKECQISIGKVEEEEVKDGQKSDVTLVDENLEAVEQMQAKPEEIVVVKEEPDVIVHVQEKPVEVLQVDEDVREKIPSTEDANETPIKEVKKEKKHNVIKKIDRNAKTNPTRVSTLKVTAKPTTNKNVTSKKTPPSKEVKSTTKKPSAPISKTPPGYSTPRVYKSATTQITSLSTSYSSVKKENVSGLLRNKQTAPKSLHMSMSLGPSASDPNALTSTRKSLIMERMGDKDIVRRAFKTFQKSFDSKTSANDQNTASKPKTTVKATSIPSVATLQKENGSRPTKASSTEKRSSVNTLYPSSRGLKSNVTTTEKQQKEVSRSSARPVEKIRLQKNPKAGVIDAKTRRDSKAKPVQGSLEVRNSPKGPLDKML